MLGGAPLSSPRDRAGRLDGIVEQLTRFCAENEPDEGRSWWDLFLTRWMKAHKGPPIAKIVCSTESLSLKEALTQIHSKCSNDTQPSPMVSLVLSLLNLQNETSLSPGATRSHLSNQLGDDAASFTSLFLDHVPFPSDIVEKVSKNLFSQTYLSCKERPLPNMDYEWLIDLLAACKALVKVTDAHTLQLMQSDLKLSDHVTMEGVTFMNLRHEHISTFASLATILDTWNRRKHVYEHQGMSLQEFEDFVGRFLVWERDHNVRHLSLYSYTAKFTDALRYCEAGKKLLEVGKELLETSAFMVDELQESTVSSTNANSTSKLRTPLQTSTDPQSPSSIDLPPSVPAYPPSPAQSHSPSHELLQAQTQPSTPSVILLPAPATLQEPTPSSPQIHIPAHQSAVHRPPTHASPATQRHLDTDLRTDTSTYTLTTSQAHTHIDNHTGTSSSSKIERRSVTIHTRKPRTKKPRKEYEHTQGSDASVGQTQCMPSGQRQTHSGRSVQPPSRFYTDFPDAVHKRRRSSISDEDERTKGSNSRRRQNPKPVLGEDEDAEEEETLLAAMLGDSGPRTHHTYTAPTSLGAVQKPQAPAHHTITRVGLSPAHDSDSSGIIDLRPDGVDEQSSD